MQHIQVIIGSVRPGRIGDQIAGWIMQLAAGIPGLTFELIDLQDWYLPLDDEPHQPKSNPRYLHQHTTEWSKKIRAGHGYVFLTPQYNWGYPASLKNALDHLYHEWVGKRAVIVSYGHRGGVKAAEQLRQVLLGLHMHPAEAAPGLVLRPEILGADGRLLSVANAFADRADEIVAALSTLARSPATA